MANQDRVNFVWAKTALTTIPPIPVSEVAYRDTKQTPEQMEVGQQYDTIYNSARHNQLLFLITSVAKTLCENGMMPFLAGQEYNQYARCLFTDGKIYSASRAIAANESPYPTPGDDSFVWIKEGGGGGTPAGSVLPFYKVNLGGPDNRNPIFWGASEPDMGWLICDGGSDGRGGSVPDQRTPGTRSRRAAQLRSPRPFRYRTLRKEVVLAIQRQRETSLYRTQAFPFKPLPWTVIPFLLIRIK